jgi:hypothetical protein
MYFPPGPAVPLDEASLKAAIKSQVEYYFSVDNLVRDTFLRSKMNGEGWINLQVIANFKRLMSLTTDINLIKEAISESTEVELDGMLVRKRTGWDKFLPLPPSLHFDITAPVFVPGGTMSKGADTDKTPTKQPPSDDVDKTPIKPDEGSGDGDDESDWETIAPKQRTGPKIAVEDEEPPSEDELNFQFDEELATTKSSTAVAHKMEIDE